MSEIARLAAEIPKLHATVDRLADERDFLARLHQEVEHELTDAVRMRDAAQNRLEYLIYEERIGRTRPRTFLRKDRQHEDMLIERAWAE